MVLVQPISSKHLYDDALLMNSPRIVLHHAGTSISIQCLACSPRQHLIEMGEYVCDSSSRWVHLTSKAHSWFQLISRTVYLHQLQVIIGRLST